MYLDISPDEADYVVRLNARLAETSRGRSTFQSLLDGYERFVLDVENGYPLDTIDDYSYECGRLLFFDEIVDEAPPSLWAKLDPILRSLDHRFLEATEEALQPFLKGDNRSPCHRVPRKRGPRLDEDLRAYGMIR